MPSGRLNFANTWTNSIVKEIGIFQEKEASCCCGCDTFACVQTSPISFVARGKGTSGNDTLVANISINLVDLKEIRMS